MLSLDARDAIHRFIEASVDDVQFMTTYISWGKYEFGLNGEALEQFLRAILTGIMEKGLRPIASPYDAQNNETWLDLGNSVSEIIENILSNPEVMRNDSDIVRSVCFVLRPES